MPASTVRFAHAVRFARFILPRLSNWNGAEVGLLCPAGPLA
jgi:hypothetical protein